MILAHERDTDESLAILTTLGLTPVINAAGSPSRLDSAVLAAPVEAPVNRLRQVVRG